MRVQLERWGNGFAFRLPTSILRQAQVSLGDTVDIVVRGPGVILLRATEKRPTLKSLVSGITSENRHGGTDCGGPVGNEV